MLLWYVSLSSELHLLAAKTWESKALSAISLGRQLSSVSSKTILRISVLPAAADLLLLSTAQILGMGSFWVKFLKAVIEKASPAWWHPTSFWLNILICWWFGTRIRLCSLETAERKHNFQSFSWSIFVWKPRLRCLEHRWIQKFSLV